MTETTSRTQTHATFRATYTDIVERERIVYSYDMWLDGKHASTSISTVTFERSDAGTHLTFTEQGVRLDGVHGPGAEAAAGREEGTAWLLGRIAEILTRTTIVGSYGLHTATLDQTQDPVKASRLTSTRGCARLET